MSSAALDAVSFAALERAQAQLRALQTTLKVVRAPTADQMDNYSISRALGWASGRIRDHEAPFEAFCHGELARVHKPTAPRSVLVPSSVLARNAFASRTLQSYQTTVATAGAELVGTNLRSDLFIDALRPRSVVLQLGAISVSGLKGDVTLPRQLTTSTAYWLGVNTGASAPITESEGTFDSSPLKVAPCQVGSYNQISRLLLQQSPLADIVIANDLLCTLGSALDIAAIQGAGSGSNQPIGITNTAGVNAISGASFSYSTSVVALSDLTTANAILSRRSLGWCAAPPVAALLAQRQKVSGFPDYCWTGNADSGAINLHPAFSTNNVPAGTAICADWSQLLLLFWGPEDAPIEIETSVYSNNFAGGDLQCRAMTSCNIAIRHPPSFSIVSSIT